MNCAVLLVFVAALVSAGYAFTDEIIFGINKHQNLWKAEHNNITRRGLRGIKKLLGTRLDKPIDLPEQKSNIFGGPFGLPDTFDARTKWPQCPTIASIKDQSSCGSCWAVATAATMSDRLCISTGFTQIRSLSSHHILSCCGSYCGFGCDGGYTTKAMTYMYYQGVVSGGEYGSNEGCQPYQIAPCNPRCTSSATTPVCSSSCLNPFYAKPLAQDKSYLKTAYSLKKVEQIIQLELMINGPILASYMVYSDFPAYKSGVYKRTSNSVIGGHSVKIIGWGSENGVPYWLVSNSWGVNWGQNGLFKILRGSNECRIEEFAIGGKF